MDNIMTFKQFKEKNPGGYILVAADDIPGFSKNGHGLYGNCDDMIVVSYSLDPLSLVYTVYLSNI